MPGNERLCERASRRRGMTRQGCDDVKNNQKKAYELRRQRQVWELLAPRAEDKIICGKTGTVRARKDVTPDSDAAVFLVTPPPSQIIQWCNVMTPFSVNKQRCRLREKTVLLTHRQEKDQFKL